MTKNMVTITETYTIGKNNDNKAPTSVYVTLGSQQQKKNLLVLPGRSHQGLPWSQEEHQEHQRAVISPR
jgi:hypothetical protein